jgi:hypothetical protein
MGLPLRAGLCQHWRRVGQGLISPACRAPKSRPGGEKPSRFLWWIVTTFHGRRREFTLMQSADKFHHLTWLQARTPAEVQDILESLVRSGKPAPERQA